MNPSLNSATAKSRPSSFFAVIAALIAIQLACVACVTVNVNFPESAVQKATDDYVKDLYRTKEKGKSAPSAPQSSLLDLLIPVAWADDFSINIRTAKTEAIKGRQGPRLMELLEKAPGQWGESREGFVEPHFTPDFKKKELLVKKIEGLIAAENSDRKELYQTVFKENNFKNEGDLPRIQKIFAKSFREAAKPGTWIQDDNGEWKKK